jgi:hypothetical protein
MSGAHVVLEEQDDTGADGVRVTRVLVNGVDVGTVLGAPKVKIGTGGNGGLTTVTLTLAPSRLEVRGELADGDHREPRAGFTAKID